MLRAAIRSVVPARARAWARRALEEIPIRLRDLPADLRERIRPSAPAVPPPGLRSRVGRNSGREEFLDIGRGCAEDLLALFAAARDPERAYPRWLDFGCGCGRVARHLLGREEVGGLDGVDVDARAIGWARRHLPGRWLVGPPEPPLPLDDASYDVVVSVSVFTHLSEPVQDAWLAELRRLLAPGGLLLASTHAPRLAGDAFPLEPGQLRALDGTGFLHVPAPGPFNEAATFHSEDYLRSVWGRGLELRGHRPGGLRGYQDLSAWRRPAAPDARDWLPIAETARLRVRELGPEDAPFVLRLVNDPTFLSGIGDRGIRTLEDARSFLAEGHWTRQEKPGHGQFLVESRETGEPLGVCGLLYRPHLDLTDIGFAFLGEHQGRGFACEAASAVLDYGRSTLGLSRIYGLVSPENAPSVRVLEKLGLRFERMVPGSGGGPERALYASLPEPPSPAAGTG